MESTKSLTVPLKEPLSTSFDSKSTNSTEEFYDAVDTDTYTQVETAAKNSSNEVSSACKNEVIEIEEEVAVERKAGLAGDNLLCF